MMLLYALGGAYALGGSIALATSNDYQVLIGMQMLTVVVLALLFTHRRFMPRRGLGVWLGLLAANLVARLLAWAIQRSTNVNKASKFRRWDAFSTTLGYAVALGYIMTTIVPGRSVLRYMELTAIGIPMATATTLALADTRDDAGLASFMHYSRLAYETHTIVDAGTDTRVLVAGDVIAFAGTDSGKNVLTDLKIDDVAFAACGNGKTRVHAGFMRAWSSVRKAVFAAMPPSGTVVFTGHSLGGALATLAGLDVACSGRAVRVVTFGAPQVGDELFADAFNERVGESVRVVIPLDPVPRSLSSQFAHVKGVYYAPLLSWNPHGFAAYEEALRLPRGQRVLGLALPAVFVALVFYIKARHHF